MYAFADDCVTVPKNAMSNAQDVCSYKIYCTYAYVSQQYGMCKVGHIHSRSPEQVTRLGMLGEVFLTVMTYHV